MNQLGKYAIITLIAFVVGVIVSKKYFDSSLVPSVVTTETKTDTIYKTVVDSIPFKLIDTVKVKSEPVVIKVPSENSIPMDVETKKYTGSEQLENGTIDYEIYADNLFATKFKLETKEKVIYNTTTITETLPTRSRFYLGGGVGFNTFTKYPEKGSIGLMYNRRQKWAVGVTIDHNFTGILPPLQATTLGVSVWVGL